MKDAVLITGIAGFVASHVSDRLMDEYHVVGLDDFSGGNRRNFNASIHFYEGSCLDIKKLQRICDIHSPKYIIHCAAMAAENLSHNCRGFTFENNLVGEARVRNAAINCGAELMVSLSSIAVMGHQKPPYNENTPPAPADPYGISKYAGELDAMAAKQHFGLNYLIFRPHNVVGTRQNLNDPFRNVAAIFIRAIKENRPLPIFGDGLQTRAFSPVSYVADIIAASLKRPDTWNNIFNVGADTPLTILELKAILDGLMKCDLPVDHIEARNEAIHAHMTHEKLQGYFPDIVEHETLSDTLSDMLAEAFAAPTEAYQSSPPIETALKLPLSWLPHIKHHPAIPSA